MSCLGEGEEPAALGRDQRRDAKLHVAVLARDEDVGFFRLGIRGCGAATEHDERDEARLATHGDFSSSYS